MIVAVPSHANVTFQLPLSLVQWPSPHRHLEHFKTLQKQKEPLLNALLPAARHRDGSLTSSKLKDELKEKAIQGAKRERYSGRMATDKPKCCTRTST